MVNWKSTNTFFASVKYSVVSNEVNDISKFRRMMLCLSFIIWKRLLLLASSVCLVIGENILRLFLSQPTNETDFSALSAGCIWMARILMCVSFAHKIGREQKVSEGGKGEVFLFLLSSPLSRFFCSLPNLRTAETRLHSQKRFFRRLYSSRTRRVATLWMHNLNNQAIVNFK